MGVGGMTPLGLAVMTRQSELVKALLEWRDGDGKQLANGDGGRVYQILLATLSKAVTGAGAKACCLLIPAEASLSLFLSRPKHCGPLFLQANGLL